MADDNCCSLEDLSEFDDTGNRIRACSVPNFRLQMLTIPAIKKTISKGKACFEKAQRESGREMLHQKTTLIQVMQETNLNLKRRVV